MAPCCFILDSPMIEFCFNLGSEPTLSQPLWLGPFVALRCAFPFALGGVRSAVGRPA